MRPWSTTGLYFAPIPLKSPVGEWHVEQRPAPLKYAAPAVASPTTMDAGSIGGLLIAAVARVLRNADRSVRSPAVSVGNGGIPFARRPVFRNSPRTRPPSSLVTYSDRARSGP